MHNKRCALSFPRVKDGMYQYHSQRVSTEKYACFPASANLIYVFNYYREKNTVPCKSLSVQQEYIKMRPDHTSSLPLLQRNNLILNTTGTKERNVS